MIDQYRVTEGAHPGIKSDPNRMGEGDYDPQHIVRLVGQVIRVSVETVKIAAGLPEVFTI